MKQAQRDRNRQRFLSIICCVVACLPSCRNGAEEYVAKLADMEQTQYRGQEVDRDRINELISTIELHERAVRERVRDEQQLGIYFKMLAVDYLDHRMFGKAIEALTKALEIDPENPILFYLIGLATARFAKSMPDAEERFRRFETARWYYERAIELDSRYVIALYGLAVLLTFELNQARAAEPLIRRILALEPRHVDAMFVLAAILVQSGELSRAMDTYRNIADVTGDSERRRRALENVAKLEAEPLE